MLQLTCLPRINSTAYYIGGEDAPWVQLCRVRNIAGTAAESATAGNDRRKLNYDRGTIAYLSLHLYHKEIG